MFRSSLWTIVVAAVIVASGDTHAAGPYSVTDLGAADAYATALNENHEVVGYIHPDGSSTDSYAFRWTADSGLTPIGGYTALDVNDHGQIAGNMAMYSAGIWEAGAWLPLAGRQDASAINNNGQVTGLISSQPADPGPYAPFRDDDIYSPGFIELVRPYPRASYGLDINNHGEVVTECGAPDAKYVGVFYAADESYVVLDNDGNYDAHAQGINDLAQIVGNTMVSNNSDHLAVFWESPDSPMEYLGTLGPGHSVADAINNAGDVVGFSAGHAFIWNRTDGMLDLNTLIGPGLDIVLTRATDISENGAIVSWGTDAAGRQRSFLLAPPEPPVVPVDVEFAPRTLNRSSQGRWITAWIRFPETIDVADVDRDSIRLDGDIEPARIAVDQEEQTVMSKFPRSEVAAMLSARGDAQLMIHGLLVDGTEFAGAGTIKVVDSRGPATDTLRKGAAGTSGPRRPSWDQ